MTDLDKMLWVTGSPESLNVQRNLGWDDPANSQSKLMTIPPTINTKDSTPPPYVTDTNPKRELKEEIASLTVETRKLAKELKCKLYKIAELQGQLLLIEE